MTATKFKPLIFSVSGFALSNVVNILIFMILDDFCLLPARFCYVIINVRNLESLMYIANQYVPRKIANGVENPIAGTATLQLKSKSKLKYGRRSADQSVLVWGTRLGPATNFSNSLFDFFLAVSGLLMWGTLSDEKSSLYCSGFATHHQGSLSQIWVPDMLYL
jgi:hypothetical protein